MPARQKHHQDLIDNFILADNRAARFIAHFGRDGIAVIAIAVQLSRATRPGNREAPEVVKKYVNYGVSVRSAQYLALGGKALAVLDGRYNVSVEDIQKLVYPVFRHRLLLNFHAESEGVTSEHIIEKLLATVPVPKSGLKD